MASRRCAPPLSSSPPPRPPPRAVRLWYRPVVLCKHRVKGTGPRLKGPRPGEGSGGARGGAVLRHRRVPVAGGMFQSHLSGRGWGWVGVSWVPDHLGDSDHCERF